jgi:hypothetical protein
MLAALACLVAGRVAVAQQASRPDGAWRPVADPIAGWHALGPVLLSVTAVAGFGTGDLNVPAPGSKFVLAAVEPGIQAGRLSLLFAYWGRWEGGGILRGTALRFWSGSPTRTYLGVEASWIISVLPIGIRVGAFKPTGETQGTKTLWLADLSVMY